LCLEIVNRYYQIAVGCQFRFSVPGRLDEACNRGIIGSDAVLERTCLLFEFANSPIDIDCAHAVQGRRLVAIAKAPTAMPRTAAIPAGNATGRLVPRRSRAARTAIANAASIATRIAIEFGGADTSNLTVRRLTVPFKRTLFSRQARIAPMIVHPCARPSPSADQRPSRVVHRYLPGGLACGAGPR
jgi:hypothetical protein